MRRGLAVLIQLSALAAPACFLEWDRLEPAAGSGGTGGGAGPGGGGVCAPSETAACYSGPDNTEGIGLCRSGTATCNADGTGFGPCEGEVTPIAEDCDTAGDDDCDGEANELDAGCSCTAGELRPCYEGPMGTEGVGSCVGGQKMCEAGGDSFTACAGQVLPLVEDCANTADDDCNGTANEGCGLWAHRFGASSSTARDYASSVAVDGSDNIILAGTSTGDIDFGGGAIPAFSGEDALVAKLDSSGNYRWARRFDGGPTAVALAVAADEAGNAYLTGFFTGTLDVGLAQTMTAVGTQDAFVIKLSAADGSAVWAAQLGNGTAAGLAIAADPAASRVAVTGWFEGSIDVGGGPVSSTDRDGFVVALDPASGAIQWGTALGGPGVDEARAVAVSPAGEVVLTGIFDETVNLGGTGLLDDGGIDGFAGKLSAAGDQLWLTKVAGGGGDQYPGYLALDKDGNVLIEGDFHTEIDFGSGPVAAFADDDLFVVKLSSGGAIEWGNIYGGAGDQHMGGVAADSAGNVWFAVSHEAVVEYGGPPVIAFGDDDWVVVKLDPLGQHLRTLRFGDSANQDPTALAVDSGDNLVSAGECMGIVNFGTGTLSGAASYEDMCLTKLPP